MAERELCGCGLAVAEILDVLRESARAAYADMVTPSTRQHLTNLVTKLQVHISKAEDRCKVDLRSVRENASIMRNALEGNDRRRFVSSGMMLRDNLTGSLSECVEK